MVEEPDHQQLGAGNISDRELTLQRTLSHAQTGYDNAQGVIKFVDSKSAFVTGLSTLSAGFLIATVKWTIEGSQEPFRAPLQLLFATHPYLTGWMLALVCLSFGAALVCLAAAVWSVIARSRPKNLENPFTVLFPVYRKNQAQAACRFFEERLRGIEMSEVLREYEDQLRVVGMILARKLKHMRVSCIALLLQMVFLSGALIVMIVLYTSDSAMEAPRSGLVAVAPLTEIGVSLSIS